jgi:hypothetical protein
MRRAFWLFGMLGHVLLLAQDSPFNGKKLVPPDSTGAYRLLIGGHFHGASTSVSGYPASTVLANIAVFNATHANVLLSTGDLFLLPDRDSARYVRSFFTALEIPLFNAPGNHDLEGTAYPMARRLPVLLEMGRDRILLLDTERDDGRLKDEQFDVLERLAERASTVPGANVFIVSHRPIWSEGDERYSELFSGNTRSLLDPGFHDDVLPVLRRIAQHGSVFWISGSMAGRAPASIFFQPEEKGITYIQCAVRDESRDAVLIADVSVNGVDWSALSLTGQELEPVQTYDAAWWRQHQGGGEEFNWRLIPYLVRKNVTQPAFAYGTAVGLILALLIIRLLRRRA